MAPGDRAPKQRYSLIWACLVEQMSAFLTVVLTTKRCSLYCINCLPAAQS